MAGLKFKDENGNWIPVPSLIGPQGPQGPKGENGVGLPAGGVAKQILVKNSGADYDYSWVNLVDLVYNVGDIILTTNNVNPSVKFGGTWELIAQGKTLIGAGTGTDINGVEKTFNVGDEVGEYEHTLTVDEMPKHVHSNERASIFYAEQTTARNAVGARTELTNSVWKDSRETGGGKAHNNIQPGFVCYIWQRTA